MKLFYSFLIFICFQAILICQHKPKDYDFITALLNADGITDVNELKDYISIYNEILSNAKIVVNQEDNIYDKHEGLFDLLHNKYLKKYTEISHFDKLLKNQDYNCVTSVILYYLICSDLGLNINIYESPFHVYITVDQPGKNEFTIELTDPVDGFDFEMDKDEFINYLVDYKLITQKEYNELDSDQLYKKFISDSYKIKPKNLLSIYYSNLASYQLLKNDTYEAYKLIKNAVAINPDSVNIIKYDVIWSLHIGSIETKTNLLSSFLLESIDSIPSSDVFRDDLIKASSITIDKNLDMNKFELADSIYHKLCSILPNKKLSENIIKQMDIDINKGKINRKEVMGEYEEGFAIASKLFNKYDNNDNVLEVYVDAGNTYIKQLGFTGKYKKMAQVADTLFAKVPDVKSVKEIYALSSVMLVANSGLYKSDTNKARNILLSAYKKLPNNATIKNSLGLIYHELAMAKIRNKNYEGAIKLLKQGLVYDPNNKDLLREINLTLDLLPKNN